MRTRGKVLLTVMGAATLLVALAEPADARRRFRIGGFGHHSSSGYAEKIDKVYDLPDTGAYFHDGKYYDLGAFYQVRDGAEIYPAEPSFVLYNGDRYVKLDGDQLTMLTVELGMDPTANYRANYAAKIPARPKSAAEVERLPGETNEELRARIRGMAARGNVDAAESAAATPASRSGPGMLFIAMLVIGGAFILWLRRFLRRGIRDAIVGPVETGSEDSAFNQRLAARLRELEAERQVPQGQSVPEAAMPAPRTFGRKLA